MSECALHIKGAICMPLDVFAVLRVKSNIAPDLSDAAAKDALLDHYSVDREHELWHNKEVKRLVPDADAIYDTCYKPIGPLDPTPLSNDEIDTTLWQWERAFPGFCNCAFAMLDFADYGGTPVQLLTQFADLYSGAAGKFVQRECRGLVHSVPAGVPRRCFAIVLNSDVLSGPGKHWTCIFVDARTPAVTVEFFNSSGNAPYAEVIRWGVAATTAISVAIKSAATSCEFVRVTSIQHQHGNTECGVYCLYYIWSRLSGVPASHFKHQEIADEKMTAFRASHLFRGA